MRLATCQNCDSTTDFNRPYCLFCGESTDAGIQMRDQIAKQKIRELLEVQAHRIVRETLLKERGEALAKNDEIRQGEAGFQEALLRSSGQ